MATLASLTLDVEDMIYGQTPEERPDVDTLTTAVADENDVAWQFDQSGNQFWSRGDYAEYETTDGTAGEIVRLMDDHDVDGADITVLRSQRQTTASGGFSIGDVFRKNPRFTRTHIQTVINEVIDSDLQSGIWYRNERSITNWASDRNRYPANASDFDIETMYQLDTTRESVGDFSYDETGGTAEDLWTISSGTHDLSVGDMVRFSSAGDGPTSAYSAGVVYFVASVESTTEITISATDGGSAIEGSGDSTSDWTLELLTATDFREFDVEDYELLTNVNTDNESTGRAVVVRRVQSTDDTIYYVARTRPSSSAISSLPTELANLIPWGVVSRLAGGTAVRRRLTTEGGTIEYADSEFFRARFEAMVDNVRRRLLKELDKHGPRFKYGPHRS